MAFVLGTRKETKSYLFLTRVFLGIILFVGLVEARQEEMDYVFVVPTNERTNELERERERRINNSFRDKTISKNLNPAIIFFPNREIKL